LLTLIIVSWSSSLGEARSSGEEYPAAYKEEVEVCVKMHEPDWKLWSFCIFLKTKHCT
jgi:hypothetical protein